MRRAEQPVTARMLVQSSLRCMRRHIPKPTRYCSVVALDDWMLVRRAAISCSILVSTSLILSSWPLLSSLIRPFSKFKSRRTPPCVRMISSRSRCFSFSMSAESRSFSALIMARSFFSMSWSSDLIWAKSTCWVYWCWVRSGKSRYVPREGGGGSRGLTFSCSALVTMFAVMLRMLSSMTSAMADMIPSA